MSLLYVLICIWSKDEKLGTSLFPEIMVAKNSVESTSSICSLNSGPKYGIQAPNMVYRPLNRFINRPRQLCCIRNCSKLQYVYKYLIACLISTAVNVCNNVLSF